MPITIYKLVVRKDILNSSLIIAEGLSVSRFSVDFRWLGLTNPILGAESKQMRRETKISILPGVSLLRRGLSFSLGAMLSLVVFSASVLAAKFTIPFSGRLTTADGMPLSGPVDLEVLFYDSSAGDKIRGLNAFTFLATKLSNGLFTVGIELSAEEVQLIFPDPHSETWIEITDHTNGRVYPRQRFNVVPYALKVPIDGNTITYNGDGVLSLGISTQPGTNEFLTKNSAGRLVWAAPADKTSTSLQGKNIDSAVPTTGQVLSFDGAKWVPKFVSTPSLSDISGVLVTAKGGTGLSAVPTNGQILIGNGAGYELSTLSAGSGISIENSSGSITISTSVVGTVTSVTAGNGLEGGPITATGSLSLANVGTAGTYAKVITDGYGRVTSGTSLTNSDITGTLGYTPLSRAGDSMSGALNIGGNDFQGVGNIQMSASKTLLLSSNSADPSGLVA